MGQKWNTWEMIIQKATDNTIISTDIDALTNDFLCILINRLLSLNTLLIFLLEEKKNHNPKQKEKVKIGININPVQLSL